MPLPGVGGFSGAEIYQVAADSRLFALRCWPAEGAHYPRLAGLHQLLAHTHRLGLTQVAVPLKAFTGQSLVWVHERWWQLEPWMPGVADFHRDASDDRLAEIMRVLARWHVAATSYVPDPEHSEWFSTQREAESVGLRQRWLRLDDVRSSLDRFESELRNYSDRELGPTLQKICRHIATLLPQVSASLQSACRVKVAVQPALLDIWHDHILLTGNQVTGLIDPSACRTECVATDLARLLGSLIPDSLRDSRGWEVALENYSRVRPLSVTEQAMLMPFYSSELLLSGATWLDWLLVHRRRFANRQKVIKRVEMIERRMVIAVGWAPSPFVIW